MSEAKDRISVIIPAYKEVGTIEHCIQAIRRQTRPADEIIVVDNNSCDATAQVAADLGCRVLCETKRGISHARNAGAFAAKGNILAFIDADGRPTSTWVERALSHLKDGYTDAVVGLNIFWHPNILEMERYNTYTYLAYAYVLAQQYLRDKTFLVGNNLAIRKTSFFSLGAFPPQVGEDYAITQEAWKDPMFQGKVDPLMLVTYSSRRFVKKGLVPAVRDWAKDTFARKPQADYEILR